MSESAYLSKEGGLYCKNFNEVSTGWLGLEVANSIASYIGESNYRKANNLVTGYFVEGLTRCDYSTIVYVPDVREVITKTLNPSETFTFPINAPITITSGVLEYSDDNSVVDSGDEISWNTSIVNLPKWDINDFLNLFGEDTYSDASGTFKGSSISRVANIKNLSSYLTKSLDANSSFSLPYDTHLNILSGGVVINGVYRAVGYNADLSEDTLVQSCWKVSDLKDLMADNTIYPTIYGSIGDTRIYQMIKVADVESSYFTEKRLIASENIIVDLDNNGIPAYVSTGDSTKDNYQSFLPLGANDSIAAVGNKLGSSNQNLVLKAITSVPCDNVLITGTPVVSSYGSYSRTATMQYSLDKSNWITFNGSVTISLNANQAVYVRQVVDTSDYGSVSFREFTNTVGNLKVYIDYSYFNVNGVWIKTSDGWSMLDDYCTQSMNIRSSDSSLQFNSDNYWINNVFTYDFSKFTSEGLWFKLNGTWTLIENKIYYAKDKLNITAGSVIYYSDNNYINATFSYNFENYEYLLNLCNANAERLFTINIGLYNIKFYGESENKSFVISRESGEGSNSSTYLTDDTLIFYTGSINEFNRLNVSLDSDNKFKLSDALSLIATKVDFTSDVWDDTTKKTPPKSGYFRLYGDVTKESDFYNVKKEEGYYNFYNRDKQLLLTLDGSSTDLYQGYILIQGYLILSNGITNSFITKENKSYFIEIGEI